MNIHDQKLLQKFGIIVSDIEYTHNELPYSAMADGEAPTVVTRGTFYIDEDRFRPMCHLIRLTDMICESKNPAVNEMYAHLVTMLELTKEEKK